MVNVSKNSEKNDLIYIMKYQISHLIAHIFPFDNITKTNCLIEAAFSPLYGGEYARGTLVLPLTSLKSPQRITCHYDGQMKQEA